MTELKSNESLVEEIKNGINRDKNLLCLWNQNRGLIFTIITKYSKSVPIEDLEQSAFLALISATENYKQGDTKFATYLVFWLKNSALEEIYKNCPLSIGKNTFSAIAKYRKMQSAYEKEFGELPSDQELQSLLRLDNNVFMRIKKASDAISTVSMDAPSQVIEDDVTVSDTVSDPSIDIESEVLDKISNEELHNELERTLTELPPDQEQVLRKKYYENIDTKTVASDMHITEERVRHLRERALRSIRYKQRTNRTLLDFYEERFPLAYKGGVGRFKRAGSVTEQIAIDLLTTEIGQLII